LKKNIKAIFLDRDGILIHERGEYTYKLEHVELVPGSLEALAKWKALGYIFIIITNQGGIGKGLYTHKILKEIHSLITKIYTDSGIKITDIYYCPHHPTSSNCFCRKPDSLMLEKAIAKYGIDKNQSFFVGDNERDIIAGEAICLKSYLIPSNDNLLQHPYLFEGAITNI
jgi:D-glycero-D-manno-heptose 1,7-bisphosphate phosphatase